jgi:hypothetical protein
MCIYLQGNYINEDICMLDSVIKNTKEVDNITDGLKNWIN